VAIVLKRGENPEHGRKTPMLFVLDAIGNAATAAQLRKIRKQLADGVPLLKIYNDFERKVSRKLHVGEREKNEHFVGHWLDTWWPKLRPEDELRKGIIEVIDLQLEKRPHRKVDYWWIPTDTESFRVVPCSADKWVTVVVLTPWPPGAGSGRPARRRP
jgi:hypothetical protein